MIDIIIIGGGPAGIAAAISAKDNGKNVLIIEGKDRIGKKLLITGNGRCNLTNRHLSKLNYNSEDMNLVNTVISSFGTKKIEEFYNYIGLPLTELNEGKMFPLSLQASSVLDILRLALEEREIEVVLEAKVLEIKKDKEIFNINTSKGTYSSKKVILSTGGNSYKNTGSDGSGYNLAKKLGHEIIKPLPSLCPLLLNYDKLKSLSGIKFNGKASLLVNNEVFSKNGEILFTDYGISGPPIFDLSKIASPMINKGSKLTLEIDLIPNMGKKDFIEFFTNHILTFSYRSISESLIGVINKKLIPVLLKEANVNDIHKPCYMLSPKEIYSIISHIKEWKFIIREVASFDMAQVTIGGVSTKEVNPSTLESALIPSLYFAGELLDVDGDCGGYNLHFAIASGIIAGKSSAI